MQLFLPTSSAFAGKCNLDDSADVDKRGGEHPARRSRPKRRNLEFHERGRTHTAMQRPASAGLQPFTRSIPNATLRPRQLRLICRASESNDLLNAEQRFKALELQLKRSQAKSSESTAPAASTKSDKTFEADLAARRQAAREWITPWLEARQRSQSHAVLSELRSRGELLSDEQEKAALARLLGTKPAAEEDPGAAAPESNGSGAVSATEEQPSRFAPSETLEDGSVVYTLSLLQSVDYEAVLAP
ncbi:hypothetical protein WJX75_007925 [Coccomyxa subellipsoidea]|uniref:Uncharacterized protein n=1 Tax=Coccomyxa subellipsoidea TaxID=248742 RepID=A0ABR2Z3W9_9CHLO